MTKGLYIISIFISLILVYLKIEIDLAVYIFSIYGFSLLTLLFILITKKFRKTTFRKVLLTTVITLSVWSIVWTFQAVNSFTGMEDTTLVYISKKIDKYKKEKGFYPKSKSSSDLAYDIGINSNYYPIDTYNYELSKDNSYYVIKELRDLKVIAYFDSRKKIEVLLEE